MMKDIKRSNQKNTKTMNPRKKSESSSDSESEVSEYETVTDEDDDYDEEDDDEEDDEDDEEEEGDDDESSDQSYRPPKKNPLKKKSKNKTKNEEDNEDTDKLAKKFRKYLMTSLIKGSARADVEDEIESNEEDTDSDEEANLSQRKKSRRLASKAKKEKKSSKSTKSSKKSKKDKRIQLLDEDSSSESDESDDDEDEKDDDQNIMIIMGGNGMTDDDYYYDNPHVAEAAEIQQILECDNDVCNSDDEKTFMKEDYQHIDYFPKEETKNQKNSKTKTSDSRKKKSAQRKQDKDSSEEETNLSVEEEYKELIDLKKHLSEKLKINPKSKILIHAMKACRESISKLVKKSRISNTKDYYKLIKTEQKNTVSEIDYFKKKLSHKEQTEIMKEMQSINEHIHIDKPYRLRLLQTKLPPKYKATVMNKLNSMQSMEPSDTEYHKMKTWVDTFMRVPFNVYKSLSVNMNDGMDVCDKFMKNAMTQLDDCVYGLDDAKMQIMQVLGQWITNPGAMGSAIAIHGPPGTGKTKLAKEGISKILGREFAFITLGGAGDSSFLEGHSYTYEGSSWGKIVQILIDSKCMNPVIFFDELDKLSDTAKGQEITGILTHLTDTTQNDQFHDKYFSEVDFDISKCLFIFSYNDENLVNPILKDRMYKIQTKGYDTKEKVVITKKYLLPKIREQVNFKEEDIIIPDETLQYIISTAKFTQNEQGVRNLKRCLEIIYTKLNLFRLMKLDEEGDSQKILGKNNELKVTFPFTVTKPIVDKLIRGDDNQNQSLLAMYV
uniref:AAA+ ATPase domain-containing protein n=1 Tax=viral metagenome TaxID=1070528 RepID=A0A6C0IBH9_9ZZZZ